MSRLIQKAGTLEGKGLLEDFWPLAERFAI